MKTGITTLCLCLCCCLAAPVLAGEASDSAADRYGYDAGGGEARPSRDRYGYDADMREEMERREAEERRLAAEREERRRKEERERELARQREQERQRELARQREAERQRELARQREAERQREEARRREEASRPKFYEGQRVKSLFNRKTLFGGIREGVCSWRGFVVGHDPSSGKYAIRLHSLWGECDVLTQTSCTGFMELHYGAVKNSTIQVPEYCLRSDTDKRW